MFSELRNNRHFPTRNNEESCDLIWVTHLCYASYAQALSSFAAEYQRCICFIILLSLFIYFWCYKTVIIISQGLRMLFTKGWPRSNRLRRGRAWEKRRYTADKQGSSARWTTNTINIQHPLCPHILILPFVFIIYSYEPLSAIEWYVFRIKRNFNPRYQRLRA